MTEAELKAIINRYLKGQSTDRDKALLEALFQSYSRQNTWPHIDELEETETGYRLMGKVKNAIRENKQQPTKSPWLLRMAAAVALVLVAGLVGYLTYTNSAQNEVSLVTKTTVRGQKSTIVLADGTNIRLNSESQLIYPTAFTADVREVTLTGEAFFNVAHNKTKPFIIKSGDLVTTVLGTSFNISAFPEEDIEVTVASGKVSVTHATSTTTTTGTSPNAGSHTHSGGSGGQPPPTHILAPGQQASYSTTTKTLAKKQVNPEKYIAWKEGTIRFDTTYLPEAIQTLERWYDVRIELEMDALQNCTVIGIYKDETLVNILESFRFINGIDYTMQGNNTIRLSGAENWTPCEN